MLAIIPETMIFAVVVWLVFVTGLIALIAHCYKKIDQGQVIIRNGFGGLRISFSGIFVIPLIHNAEFLDITLKRLVVHLTGKNDLLSKDGVQIDIKAAFFVRVKPTVEDIRKVVQALGIKGASDTQVLYDLFCARFIEALKKVSSQYDFNELSNREFFKDQVMSIMNLDSDGYILDVMAIDELTKDEESM